MEHTYSYLKRVFQRISNLLKDPNVFIYLLAAILVAIPLRYAFGSISSIVFLAVCFSTFHKIKFTFNKAIILPIVFYAIMLLSLFWTRDPKLTTAGLQKETLFLLIPIAFLLVPDLSKFRVKEILKIYSYAMVLYALYYFVRAIARFILTGRTEVFFYHELVTMDVNAIYVSVFASLAMFYFIAIKKKTTLEQVSTGILIVLVFLLSSKSLIFIDFLLIACFYSFFSGIPKSVRLLTLITVSCFLIFSMLFVKKIRERFLIEYETAFVDNTINNAISTAQGKVYNISLKQAWNDEKFQENNFFPGTALRLYQFRIFIEMLREQPIFFTGFGLEASQDKIREKTKEHHLYPAYGDFNFHNQYVQTFAELGLFGFLTLIGMLIINFKNALANKNFLHIVFSVTMIILFLTESFFCRQRGITFFIVLYCIFNSVRKPVVQKSIN